MLAFQSLAQCEVIYSKAESRVLMENCRIKAICECSDDESQKQYLVGVENIEIKKKLSMGEEST